MEEITVSIITVCFNSAKTINDTICSVLEQSYPRIEYIIVDGLSTDGTVDIIKSYGNKISKFISEHDNGIYDAINKGIRLSAGDIVGIINSDDFFYNKTVVADIIEVFKTSQTDTVYGDVFFVNPRNPNRVLRYFSSRNFHPGKFRFGFMPPHATFYAKKVLFEKYGDYKTDYKIAADFELLLRFIYINGVSYRYVDKPFVVMRSGGISNKNLFSRITLNNEIARACRENKLNTNLLNIYSKYFTKFFEFTGKRLKDRKLWPIK